jgi:hypothetical protein
MKPALILLHGLPGAGKTTAARLMAELDPEIFFVDWGSHPEFGKRPVRTILAEEYLALADGRSMITEGVFEDRRSRDRLVSSVIAAAAESACPLRAGVIVYLDEEDSEVLATRRSKPAGFYAEKRVDVVEGSELFPWIRYSTSQAPDEPRDRARELLRLIGQALERTHS